jgi:putative ABC transport system permease protein
MRTPLAWYNLAHHKVRTIAAVAGVTFAVVLIFMQLGFRGMAEKTASLFYEALDFDLLLRAKDVPRLSQSRPFPQVRLYQVASAPGVQGVSSLLLTYNRWQSTRRTVRPILTLGVAPDEPVFSNAELRRQVHLLVSPQFALIDRASRAEFGPRNGQRFDDEDVGTEAELGGQRVRIVGLFLLGTTFDSDGVVVLNSDGFRRVRPEWPAGQVNLGLIRLAAGVDPGVVARELKSRLAAQNANDVEVFTRTEVIDRERWVWLWQQSIGVIFTMGVIVAFVVGSVIVYQVLSSDVVSHLPEYATLKAMGYSNAFLSRIVLTQAIILALLGFVPGAIASQLLYLLTAWQTRLPLDMTLLRLVGVLGLSIAMCIVSGMVALRKLHHADPADLY